MPQKVQILRTSTKGTRPTPATRSAGELYVNFPDLQLGTIDASQNPKDLVGVRFFSTAADYAIGDFAVNAGVLYRAKAISTAGAFNAANWDAVSTAADLSLYAPLADPVFTGNPRVPTASPPTSSTTAASTAFVANAVSTSAALKEDKANKAVANGYASLDAGAKVPAAQLPSYVDDVLEYANLAAFPATGTTGVIYVALDTGKIYRWTGTVYVEISPSPGSTDSVPEGSVNLYYTNARASAAAPVQSVAGRTGAVVLTKTDVGLANVDNTSDVNKPVSTAQQTALNGKENTIAAGTTAQYWRGDKTFQTLDKTAVGLANVDNTSDVNKPVSTAQQTALNLKANIAGPTFTGKVITQGTSTGTSGFNLPHGTAPSVPANGDLWTTTAGLYTQINGVTVGPLGAGATGISDAPNDGKAYMRQSLAWVEIAIDVGTF